MIHMTDFNKFQKTLSNERPKERKNVTLNKVNDDEKTNFYVHLGLCIFYECQGKTL